MPDAARALEVLRDPGFIVSNLPGVTAVEPGRVRVEYRRFGLPVFRDWYTVEVREASDQRAVIIELAGEKSRARMLFTSGIGGLEVKADYRGPRGFLVAGALRKAARALAKVALREAARLARAAEAAASRGDLSRALADLSWTSSLLARSVLLDTRLASAAEGVLSTIAEEALADTGALTDYPMVYVSGKAENGSFRLIFSKGRLAGAYLVVDGREYYGSLDALKRLRGITTIRVYGVL
ncbi:MAG: hypothetical protein LRS49_02690, partial [Desulfurococcales archaeon]|nr:hypothetical protein [Desulfurococcales archaeon]